MMKKIIFLISFFAIVFGVGLSLNFFKVGSMYAQQFDISLLENKKNIMPLVVIGSGPAGLSAGIYGARGNVGTLIIRGDKPGGALTETSYIENMPGRKKILGAQLIADLQDQAKSFGAYFLNDSVESVNTATWPYEIRTTGGKTMYALTIVVATGSTPRTLGIPGEKEYWGKGVTTCAICDAPYHKGNDVIVVGGGDSAAEEAMQLALYAKTITIVVRKNYMRAAASMQERLKAFPNISIVYDTTVEHIYGEDEVTSVDLKNVQTGEIANKKVQGVFLAIGHDPNTTLFKNKLSLDNAGYIVLKNRSQKTSKPGIFAAGDVEDDHYKQAGVAAGNGIKAALDAHQFLQDHGLTGDAMAKLEKNFFDDFMEGHLPVEVIASIHQFEQAVQESKEGKLVVFDFYASYCPSCMRMIPALEAVAYQHIDSALFYKIDVEASPELVAMIEKQYAADHVNVRKVPALLVFADGTVVEQKHEALNKTQLYTMVNNHRAGQ